MSIVIERKEGGNHLGECEYTITQDGEYLTTFIHDRTDDLPVLFQKASEAVAKGRWEQTNKLYSKTGGG